MLGRQLLGTKAGEIRGIGALEALVSPHLWLFYVLVWFLVVCGSWGLLSVKVFSPPPLLGLSRKL